MMKFIIKINKNHIFLIFFNKNDLISSGFIRIAFSFIFIFYDLKISFKSLVYFNSIYCYGVYYCYRFFEIISNSV